MGDDAKKTILARRARFIAAAMAGLAADGCGKADVARDGGVESAPRPCLEVAPAPQPCLKMAVPRATIDGGTQACDPPYTVDANGQKHYKPDCP